ncbi:hypothetical protein TWF788_011260 [Orbilia oligospora]|uniref:C2H2-type domain-containing protein n=1 Tax=Orbilia oligospora TaxID=2813651 RepID=A0A7C8U9D6_ORBOL|nr:hypothetical protein TWF788_011260 [Orbilia oligospora]
MYLDNFDLSQPLLPQFTSWHQFNLYSTWLEHCTEDHQDGFDNRWKFFEDLIEYSRARRLLESDMRSSPTYPMESLTGTVASLITPLNDNTPFPQIHPLPTNVTLNDFDIPGGMVPSPPMTLPTLSPTNSISPPFNPNGHDGSPESQSELIDDGNFKLKRTDVKRQIQEISLEKAMENRSERNDQKKATERSEKKKTADRCRVEKNASGLKPRKERTLKCPELECKSTVPWSNKKKFQDHLSGHDIRCFVCELCGNDFSRLDNAVDHLLKSKELSHVENRGLLLAKKIEKEFEINSQSSESSTPSFTYEIPLLQIHTL